MDDYTFPYNPYTIMQFPEFWRGALVAREGEPMTHATLLVHKLLGIAERGEDVTKSDEFAHWIGCWAIR